LIPKEILPVLYIPEHDGGWWCETIAACGHAADAPVEGIAFGGEDSLAIFATVKGTELEHYRIAHFMAKHVVGSIELTIQAVALVVSGTVLAINRIGLADDDYLEGPGGIGAFPEPVAGEVVNVVHGSTIASKRILRFEHLPARCTRHNDQQ